MSEELRCPCCSENLVYDSFYDERGASASYSCISCEFMCNPDDLPRIAAAMELARLEVQLENCKPEDEHKYQEIIAWAREYVLEVFK